LHSKSSSFIFLKDSIPTSIHSLLHWLKSCFIFRFAKKKEKGTYHGGN